MVEEEVVAATLVAVPGIYLAIQMVKLAVSDYVPARLWPIIAVVVGVIWQIGWTLGTDEFGRESIFLGAISGMSATGLHNIVEATRDTVNGVRNSNSS